MKKTEGKEIKYGDVLEAEIVGITILKDTLRINWYIEIDGEGIEQSYDIEARYGNKIVTEGSKLHRYKEYYKKLPEIGDKIEVTITKKGNFTVKIWE